MTMPRQSDEWTPGTLYLYTERRFIEQDRRFSDAVAAQKSALEQFETEVSKRFDGMDQNLDRVIRTITERTGALNLMRTVIPSLISIASILALIVVSSNH